MGGNQWMLYALMGVVSVGYLILIRRTLLPSKHDQSEHSRNLRKAFPRVIAGVLGFLAMLWAAKQYGDEINGEWIVFGVMLVAGLAFFAYIFGPDREPIDQDADPDSTTRDDNWLDDSEKKDSEW